MQSNQQQICPINSRSFVFLFIKQILFICLIFISSLFSTYSSANSIASNKATIDLTTEEKAWLKQNPYIKLSALSNQPPISMKGADGKPSGILKDIYSHLSRVIGQEIKLELVSDNKTIHARAKEKGMYGSTAILKSNGYLLTEPYLYTPLYVYTTQKNLSSIKTTNDLKGQKVAVLRNHRYMSDYLDKIVNVKKIIVDSPIEQMQKVINGEADALMGYVTYPYLINKYLMANLKVAFIAKSNVGIRIGVNPEHPILHGIFNKAIATLSEQTIQHILTKWTRLSQNVSLKIELTKEEQEWLAAHPAIRIGVDADYAPYSFRNDDGNYRGIALEFCDYLSEQLGISMEVVQKLSWPEIVDGVRERKLDLVTTFAHRPEREAFANFTKIYLPTPLIIMRHSGVTSISSEDDLEGRIVAMVEGYSSSARILEEHPDVKPLMVKTAREGLFAVSTGKANAYVGVLGINLYLMNELGITNLEVASLYGTGENGQRFGVRKDWPELATILDKALAAMPVARKREIFERWLPTQTAQFIPTEKSESFIEQQLTPEERGWLTEHPVIRLGNSVDWPPFGFINQDGVYSGIAADYFALIEKMLGITIEPAKLGSWKETVDAARKGEVELLDAVVPTPQRREFLTFTKPYISYPVVLFAHKDVDYIASMSELNGQRVSVIAGSALHDILINNHPEFEIIPTKNAKAGLLAVERREASAFIGNLPTASRVISREGISNLKVAGETPYRYDLTIGINKNKPILATLLQKALDNIPEEKHNEIYRKWMSVTFEHQIDYSLFIKLFALSIFIFIFIFMWNRQRQIKILTLEVESRKKIEESLRKSEKYNRMLFEESTIGLALCQMNGELVDINPAFASILGRTVEETKSLSYWDITPEKYTAEEQEQLKLLDKTGRYGPYEKEYIHADGHLVPVRLSGQLLKKDGTNFIWSSIEDITERKQAEEMLRKSEETNIAIIETSKDWIWAIDLDGIHTYSNSAVENILGYKSGELIGSHSIDLMHDDDKELVKSNLENWIRDRQGWNNLVIRWHHKNGGYRYLESNAVPSFNAEKELVGFIGVDRDITERIQFEKSLQESEEKYRLTMEATRDGLWDWDITTGCVYYSPSWSSIIGELYVKNDYSTWESRIHQDDKVRIIKTLQAHLNGETEIWKEEHRLRNANETWRWVLGRGRVVERDEKGKPLRMVGTMTDISEQKQAEDEKENLQLELQQSQKMEALGKLTGGIAHEYNNMLGITMGFAELLKAALIEQPKLAKYADEIQRAGKRGAKLTKKLLKFSKQKTPEADSLNLNTLLQKQYHMLEKTLTVRINLVLKLQENPWLVWLDSGDMEDVILNICINAMHAIEGNGQLTIETRNQKINQMDAQSLAITPGDYVLLSFTDTGCGIDKKNQEKIFDPFFTTKGEQGTGLGLSMVYGFMQNSGGTIKVYSEQGEGTQFTLYFPRYHGTRREQTSEKENNSKEAFIGNKTILVVDDEPALLNLTHEILSSRGFNIICAESAKAALNILEHESIDILLSDIIMPGMDGYQLAAMVKEKYPDIKIQLVSGFTDDRNIGMVDESLRHNLLHKPFNLQDLLQRIYELCDEN